MDGTPTIESSGHIIAPGRPLHNCFKFSLHTLVLWQVMGLESVFWEDLWWGDQPLCVQFPSLFKVTTTKNCLISTILGNNTLLSRDLVFCRNLTDTEIEYLERLTSLLSNVHLPLYISDTRSWIPSSSGVFSVKSFFSISSYSPDSVPFYPTNFLWNSKVPSKVKAFSWLVTLKKVNTNDLLQLRRPSKPLILIGASYVEVVVKQFIIFSCIIRLFWDCGKGFFHKLGWSRFRPPQFVI